MESRTGTDADRGNQAARKSPADEVRYRTLRLVEQLLQSLVARYGARMTLGELLAVTAFMTRMCDRDRMTIAELAEVTGLPKQNLSRWARKRLRDSIQLEVDPEDQRRHELILADPSQAQEYIAELARLLGTDADRSRA